MAGSNRDEQRGERWLSGGSHGGGCACAGELLSLYRPQLEALLAGEGRSGLTASPLRSGTTAAAKARKKRSAARKEAESDYEARAPCLSLAPQQQEASSCA